MQKPRLIASVFYSQGGMTFRPTSYSRAKNRLIFSIPRSMTSIEVA